MKKKRVLNGKLWAVIIGISVTLIGVICWIGFKKKKKLSDNKLVSDNSSRISEQSEELICISEDTKNEFDDKVNMEEESDAKDKAAAFLESKKWELFLWPSIILLLSYVNYLIFWLIYRIDFLMFSVTWGLINIFVICVSYFFWKREERGNDYSEVRSFFKTKTIRFIATFVSVYLTSTMYNDCSEYLKMYSNYSPFKYIYLFQLLSFVFPLLWLLYYEYHSFVE